MSRATLGVGDARRRRSLGDGLLRAVVAATRSSGDILDHRSFQGEGGRTGNDGVTSSTDNERGWCGRAPEDEEEGRSRRPKEEEEGGEAKPLDDVRMKKG
jgi:hypothetical protein